MLLHYSAQILTEVLRLPKNLNMGPMDRDYVDSGNWKCGKSPTGAHHWVISQSEMTCKHCTETRQVVLPIKHDTNQVNTKLEIVEAQFANEMKPDNDDTH
jgi:hypothetical protein